MLVNINEVIRKLSPAERKKVEERASEIIAEELSSRDLRKASPQHVLQHLMEAHSLTQKDLWKLLGSKGITSEVFHAKRAISKTQAKKLAAFFHVTPDLFI